MASAKFLTLNNGEKMPIIGIGTWQVRIIQKYNLWKCFGVLFTTWLICSACLYSIKTYTRTYIYICISMYVYTIYNYVSNPWSDDLNTFFANQFHHTTIFVTSWSRYLTDRDWECNWDRFLLTINKRTCLWNKYNVKTFSSYWLSAEQAAALFLRWMNADNDINNRNLTFSGVWWGNRNRNRSSTGGGVQTHRYGASLWQWASDWACPQALARRWQSEARGAVHCDQAATYL